MKNDQLRKVIKGDDLSIKDAMNALNDNALQFLVIVSNNKLVGFVTDGDIRRFIISGGRLSSPVCQAMNKNPRYLHQNDYLLAQRTIVEYGLKALPIVDSELQVVDVVVDERHWKVNEIKGIIGEDVVIMAGGKGSRLYPYTKILPKPLIPIDETPIVERIMDEFSKYQVSSFYLSVNYKASMIKSYFDDSGYINKITYVNEDEPLGTAGSLNLIGDKLSETFVLTNCDILIKADYKGIIDHHKESKNVITVVTSLKNIVIPYGVFEVAGENQISSMKEKPSLDFLVNTGFYIVDKRVLALTKTMKAFNMTDVITLAMDAGLRVGLYPISENSWMDMGQITEMKKMISHFERLEG